MKTRIIHTKIWDDDFFTDLDEHAQYLFFYLITNHRINLCGIYELPNKVILRETKIKPRDLLKAKENLAPKVLFYKTWVWVLNAQRHGGYKGEKNDTACEREMSIIPVEVINGLNKQKEDRVSVEYRYPSDTSINHKLEIINHKSKYSSVEFLKNLPQEEIDEFVKKFNITPSGLKRKSEELIDWCEANGKKKKNYKAFLRNAVRKDFGDRPPEDEEKQARIKATQEKFQGSSEYAKQLKDKFQIKK